MATDSTNSSERARGIADFEISVIVPAHNEAPNLVAVVQELDESMRRQACRWEFIIVDDSSTDDTAAILKRLSARYDNLQFISLKPPAGKPTAGQSAAYWLGLRYARGRYVVLFDADRQNVADDIPIMLRELQEQEVDMVQGDRSRQRQDSNLKKISSCIGRLFRYWCLQDDITDTGCSLRVFKREVGLELPLQYAGMHRFIPWYVRLLGYTVVEHAVRHRPRVAGSSKYGTWDRARAGIFDLLAMRWMRSRLRVGDAKRIP